MEKIFLEKFLQIENVSKNRLWNSMKSWKEKWNVKITKNSNRPFFIPDKFVIFSEIFHYFFKIFLHIRSENGRFDFLDIFPFHFPFQFYFNMEFHLIRHNPNQYIENIFLKLGKMINLQMNIVLSNAL